jgi:hypothetical protein
LKTVCMLFSYIFYIKIAAVVQISIFHVVMIMFWFLLDQIAKLRSHSSGWKWIGYDLAGAFTAFVSIIKIEHNTILEVDTHQMLYRHEYKLNIFCFTTILKLKCSIIYT